MTDLLNNGSALEQQIESLDVQLVSFQSFVDESKKFVQNPDTISDILTNSTNQNGSPFLNFQKKLQT